jgi:Kef-type K+ transport system membrane component KefB
LGGDSGRPLRRSYWAIIGLATLGKLSGAMFTACFSGLSWPTSFALGALMNTRALMELITLNIGYDLGIIGPEIFAIMVIMALVTTIMTGPLLSLSQRFERVSVSKRESVSPVLGG